MTLERLNRTDASSDAEINKIKEKHEKQLSRKYTQDERMFSILAYVGPLFVFPLLLRQTSNFCQFHARQGMLLFGAEIIFWLGSFLPFLGMLFEIAALIIFLAGAAAGIRNVIKEKEDPLPIIGKYGGEIGI